MFYINNVKSLITVGNQSVIPKIAEKYSRYAA